MEGYCESCRRWFDIEQPELDAGFLCPSCLTHAVMVRADQRSVDPREPVVTEQRMGPNPARERDSG